jgi:hypothetical protein
MTDKLAEHPTIKAIAARLTETQREDVRCLAEFAYRLGTRLHGRPWYDKANAGEILKALVPGSTNDMILVAIALSGDRHLEEAQACKVESARLEANLAEVSAIAAALGITGSINNIPFADIFDLAKARGGELARRAEALWNNLPEEFELPADEVVEDPLPS